MRTKVLKKGLPKKVKKENVDDIKKGLCDFITRLDDNVTGLDLERVPIHGLFYYYNDEYGKIKELREEIKSFLIIHDVKICGFHAFFKWSPRLHFEDNTRCIK